MTGYSLLEKISHKQVQTRIGTMAKEIATDYQDQDLTMAIVLLGAISFGGRLFEAVSQYREPRSSVSLEALGVASYDTAESNGEPRITQPFKNAEKNIRGANVLIAEDIIHTGLTMVNTVLPHVWSFAPKSVAIATLLEVDGAARVIVPGKKYVGFHLDKKDYVTGEGLDMEGLHRGGKGIYKVIFSRLVEG